MTDLDAAIFGERRFAVELAPVSGKAVALSEGEILRVSQTVGEQCVDFNAFNLQDYKEYMSTGHSRRQGFHLSKGHVLLSNRMRPLMGIVGLSASCVTDVLAARCNAPLFERKHGVKLHTNCQDTLAAAIGEYGLTSDDVHDSFNIWMNTGWDSFGRMWSDWNSAKEGDYIDLLACRETLAVPVVCGSGDLAKTSNFGLRPIQVEIFKSTDESRNLAARLRSEHWSEVGEVRATEASQEAIRQERTLSVVRDHIPEFPRFPLKMEVLRLRLPDEIYGKLRAVVTKGYATDVGDAVRKATMFWYLHEVVGGDSWYPETRLT